jgi:hypothetical protein
MVYGRLSLARIGIMNLTKLASVVRRRAGLAFVLCVVSSQAASAQQPAAPEAIPVPPPMVQAPLLPLLPPAKYDSLEAARDAYLRAEAQRREAIARQLAGNAYAPSHIFPLGMYLRLGPVYAYLPPAGRWGYRAYAPPIVTAPPYGAPNYATRIGVWPGLRAALSPYVDRAEQPLGHVVTPTGPNGYVYRPYYKEDLQPKSPLGPPEAAVPWPPAPQAAVPQAAAPQAAVPQPPVPQPPVPQPPAPPPVAAIAPPAALPAAIERVPAPQPESGPREF